MLLFTRIVASVQEKYGVFGNTPHYGTIDGFPVEVYINNEFLGLYTWNIPKDEWMWNLDKNNPNHIVLGGGEWTNSTHFNEEITTFEDSGWEVEVGPEDQETIDKFNRVIRFVKDSSNEEFIRDFELYINKDAALNYMVSLYLIQGTDNIAKNLMMVTYDGVVWFPSLYDLDTTFGTEWDGTLNNNWDYIPESYGSKLWLRMKECFPSEIANRWFELRRNLFTKENVLNEFNNFINTIPVETYQKDAERWGNIPGYGIDEIEEFLNYRIPYIDNIMTDTYNKNNINTEVSIEYSTKEKTNKEVVATLKSNRTDTVILKNGEVTYDNTHVFEQNGTYTFEYQDWIGLNKKTIVASVDWIDKEAPVANVTYSTTEPTNQNVIATIENNEQVQEVEGWTLTEDKKTLTKEYGENVEETVIVKDLLGNETQVKITITNIDKIAPQVEVIYAEQEKDDSLNYIQKVTIQSNEPLQEIEGWTLSENKKEMSKIYKNSVEENIEVKDIAGNITLTPIKIIIDNSLPTTNVTYSTTEPTNQNVIATITADKEIQKLEGWTLTEDKRTLTKEYGENVEETVIVKDLLGNETQVKITITNIDKIAPQVEVIYEEQKIEDSSKCVQKVTIRSDEPLQKLEGWTLSENKKEMLRIYENSVEENIEIKDLAGNISLTSIKVIIKEIIRGDVNEDGRVDTSDFLKILRHITLGKSEEVKNKHPEWMLSGKALEIADTDNNGKVDITDLLKIQRHMAATKSETVRQKYPNWILTL